MSFYQLQLSCGCSTPVHKGWADRHGLPERWYCLLHREGVETQAKAGPPEGGPGLPSQVEYEEVAA